MDRFAFREVYALTITTDGSGDGNATTTDTLRGALWALDVDYGTADGTTVLTVYIVGASATGGDRLVYTSAAGNTNGLKFPRAASVKAADGSAGTGEEVIPIAGRKVKIVAASTGATKTVTVKLFILQ